MLSDFLLLIVFPFILWMISWWGFIWGKYSLGSDAYYYYWDNRYFLDNICHGVYPLWNPLYAGGVPWNFFLRRMGELNPCYWLIPLFKCLGCTPYHAHLLFVVLYYFLGLVGFWLLAKLFLKDRLTSTAAYLLLLFSWGSQIFYCFDVLVFVPLVWLFYFVFAFAQEFKKHQLLGGCLTLSIILTTYIPFFALTILFIFFSIFVMFYFQETKAFFKSAVQFFNKNRIFTALSVGLVLLSCVYEGQFYLESKGGGFVMPTRHLGSTDASVLAVAVNNNVGTKFVAVSRTVWDIVAHGYFDRVFANQHNLSIGDFNIAYLFFIVFFLSIINPASRKTAVLLIAAVLITLIGLTNGRIYPFLLAHVSFFHYMRMLHLFFWLGVLPMVILMVMEQLRVFLDHAQAKSNIKVMIFVIAVHLFLIGFLLTQPGVLWTSYLTVVLSLVFFVMAIAKGTGTILVSGSKPCPLQWLLWLSLIIQPMSFIYCIEKNSTPAKPSEIFDHISFYRNSLLLSNQPSVNPGISNDSDVMESCGYYENPWLDDLRQHIFKNVTNEFTSRQLMLVDNTYAEDSITGEQFYKKLSLSWRQTQDFAFVPSINSVSDDFQTLQPNQTRAQVVYDGFAGVKVLLADANTLKLATNLDKPKFLLWADGYDEHWHVYIDGMESRLLRADEGYKGVWLTPGEHEIVFRFCAPQRYAASIFLLIIFMVVFFYIPVLRAYEQ